MALSHRLSGADFKALRPQRRISGRFFTLAVADHPRGPKWACVVSKKVSSKAAARNKVKRRCRSSLAEALSSYTEPFALVLYARAGAAEASYADVKADILALVRRLGGR